MASIDYGAIAFKNDKLVSADRWTPMIDMVGWEDTEDDVVYDYYSGESKPLSLSGDYFAYIGDSDCTIAFYKGVVRIVERYVSKDGDVRFKDQKEYIGSTNYVWSSWEARCGRNFDRLKITRRNGYFVCKWKYKGDKYKVYFGYGVDYDYYKKWHIVNYYRSPTFRLDNVARWFGRKKLEIGWKLS